MFTLVFAAIVLPTRASRLGAYCAPLEFKVRSLLHQLRRAPFLAVVPSMNDFRSWSLPCFLHNVSNARGGPMLLPTFVFLLRGDTVDLSADSGADEFVSRGFEAAGLAIRQTQGFLVHRDADSLLGSHILHTIVYHFCLTSQSLKPCAERAGPGSELCLPAAGKSPRNRCGAPPRESGPRASQPCRHRARVPPPGTRWVRCPCLR